MNDDEYVTDPHLTQHFPMLCNFLETVLWPGGDGGNVIGLLLRVTWLDHKEAAIALVNELRAISEDKDVSAEVLSDLFNRTSYSPYVVVSAANSKAFGLSMAEALEFILSKRTES